MAVSATTNGSKQKSRISSTASSGEIRGQLEQLKADMAGLGEAIATAGANRAGELKDGASQTADALAASSQEAYETLKVELARLERQLSGHVQSKPIQSLGIALGIGFLAALLMRR